MTGVPKQFIPRSRFQRAVVALELFQAFWFFLPAYVANPTAVLFGGGTPMDFGKVLKDGKRLFGDGKTWRGFGGGVMCGIVLGLVLWGLAALVYEPLEYGAFPGALTPLVLLPVGALLGDLVGSFIKRRMGKPKGAPVLGLDQYDFMVGAMVLLAIFQNGWFIQHYWEGEAVFGLIFVIVLTPFLHRAVNIVGYRLGKKEVPW
jgi:CDP-2,3-bis-(O-geranylgeranyl)-sn-glycerol synthase